MHIAMVYANGMILKLITKSLRSTQTGESRLDT